MMKKKMFLLGSVLITLALLVTTACSNGGEAVAPEGDIADENSSTDIKVALLLPGPINDGSWNTSAYNGLIALEEQGGYTIDYTERISINDIEEAFRNYAELGYNLIIGHGFEFGEPALRVAPDFPEVNFYISGKPPVDEVTLKNISFIDQKEFEGAFLCGAVAGLMTESNMIGYVGGMKIPAQIANMKAFEAGAQYVNAEAEILGVLTGTYEDPAKGKEAAEAQIDNGADIIMQAADSTGIGAIEAAKAAGVKIIGYGADQNELAPELILTCLIADIPAAIKLQGERIKAGNFESGIWKAGLADGIIYLAPYHGNINDEVAEKIDEIKQGILDGSIMVPEVYTE